MVEEEVEMTYDKLNYEVLAQIYTIINDNISQKTIVMENVLKKDFDINYVVPRDRYSLPNIAGHTALDFALNRGELEVFKLLIRLGANFTDKNRNRTTVLHRIIEESYVNNEPCYELKGKLEHPFVQPVLSAHVESNVVANPHNRDGIFHFHIACMCNHYQAVEYFLAQGVCVNQAINQDSTILPGYTPLHLSARYSAFETAKLLLDHNANFELKDAQGAYPLHLLLQRNMEILDWSNVQKQKLCEKLKDELVINEKIIELLIEKTKNKEDITRCQVACTLQDTRILEQILTEGKNLNDSVSENSLFWPGYTALHFAAIFNINAMRLLLANGANVLAKDPNGVTPLDLCLQRYSPEVIHSIVSTVAEFNDVRFLNTNTKLCDLFLAMSEEESLKTFMGEATRNVNEGVPLDSPVWPGYTILHIAVALSDRLYENKNPYKDTDYKHDEIEDWPYYEEAEYFKRIKLCLTLGADVTITDFYKSTPLHLAFRLQNRNVVELLLKHHDRLVDVVDGGNLSHLHIACAMARNELVKKLLQIGADVNRPVISSLDFRFSDDGNEAPEFLHVNPGLTCLHIVVATSNADAAKILIEYGADLYAKDSFEITPIHQVLRSTYYNFGFNALSSIRYEDRVTSYGLTHLHAACVANDLEAVKKLLENGADIEAKINYNKIRSAQVMEFLAPFDGYTPLHFALRNHRLELVKLLVRRGANLFVESTGGFIPFYEALKTPFECDDDDGFSFSKNSDYENYGGDENYGDDHDTSESTFALKLMCDKKIEKLVKKHSGITKLHIACLGVKKVKVVQLLYEGAKPNVRVHADSPIWPGYTPLHVLMVPRFTDDHEYQYEIYLEIEKIGKLLLERGACVMLEDTEGNTPIHMAPQLMWSDSKIEEVGLQCVGWILEGLSDFTVNPTDVRGISHFEVACMTAKDKVVRKFLKQGVDVNRHFGHFTDRYGGFTPLHLASFYKTDSVVDILVNYGADPHVKDFLGNTPLHAAAVYCRLGNNGLRADNQAIYEILLNAGADAEAKNLWNESPLAVTLRMGLFTYSTLCLMVENNRTCRANLFNPENEEGLLGLALSWRSRCWSIEEHCYYKTIADAPNSNDTDEMGRTVIHNVVSVNKSLCGRKNGSIEDYIRIIHGFVKLDFHIDCQDDKGQTALHKAARFGNYNAIIGLLMNGADINIVDASNKPAFAYSLERNEEEGEDTEVVRHNILQACLLHVYKLQIAGLEISDANQGIVAQIRKQSISCHHEMQSCSEELERLKKQTITDSYSLTMYNFLSETTTYFRMILFLRDTIDYKFLRNAAYQRKIYPQFAGLLQMQYRNVFIRSQLVDPAKIALSILAGFEVPDLCSDKILKCLKNNDLKQVISATEFL